MEHTYSVDTTSYPTEQRQRFGISQMKNSSIAANVSQGGALLIAVSAPCIPVYDAFSDIFRVTSGVRFVVSGY